MEMTPARGRRWAARLLALSVSLCLLVAGCLGGESPHVFNGEEPNVGGTAYRFTLIDQDNENWSLSDAEGKVVVLTFMFTRCPDVCLAVTSSMLWVQSNLDEADREQVQFVSVTVDPWSDTSEVMREYSSSRGAEWPHLTVANAGAGGDSEQNYTILESIWGQYGVGLEMYGIEDDTDYLIEHALPTYILDRTLEKRVVWPGSEWDPESFKRDVEYLLQE